MVTRANGEPPLLLLPPPPKKKRFPAALMVRAVVTVAAQRTAAAGEFIFCGLFLAVGSVLQKRNPTFFVLETSGLSRRTIIIKHMWRMALCGGLLAALALVHAAAGRPAGEEKEKGEGER